MTGKKSDAKFINLEIPLAEGKFWSVKDAEVIGDLAIHEQRPGKGYKFTITHLPTSLSFTSIIPAEYGDSKSKLKKWAAAIQLNLQKDWLAMRKFEHDDVLQNPERTKAVRGRIREMALNTKV